MTEETCENCRHWKLRDDAVNGGKCRKLNVIGHWYDTAEFKCNTELVLGSQPGSERLTTPPYFRCILFRKKAQGPFHVMHNPGYGWHHIVMRDDGDWTVGEWEYGEGADEACHRLNALWARRKDDG